jgi:hypothetical protein
MLSFLLATDYCLLATDFMLFLSMPIVGDAPHRALTRLTHFLIAKSIIEALLVGALAVGFYLTAFNPFFRGTVDSADSQHVNGWAVNERAPGARVEVQLYIDGRFAQSRVADLARPDVKAAGRAVDEWHGFSFDTPPLDPGEHEARVYVVHASGEGARRTLQLLGNPKRFNVDVRNSATHHRDTEGTEITQRFERHSTLCASSVPSMSAVVSYLLHALNVK